MSGFSYWAGGTDWRTAKNERSLVSRARRERAKGNARAATRLLAPLAARGHPEAAYLLSTFSRPRESERQFEARLVAGTLAAANRRHPPAMWSLAMWLEFGDYLDKDLPRSHALVRAAAALGHAPAQWDIGVRMLHGTCGESQDVAAGLELIEASARQDFEGGLRTLATLLREGSYGVAIDAARADELTARAESTKLMI